MESIRGQFVYLADPRGRTVSLERSEYESLLESGFRFFSEFLGGRKKSDCYGGELEFRALPPGTPYERADANEIFVHDGGIFRAWHTNGTGERTRIRGGF